MSAKRFDFRHNVGVAPTVPISWHRVFYPVLLIAPLVVLVFFAKEYLNDPVRFPVTRVEVGGEVNFSDKSQLMSLIKMHTSKGFFGLDIEAVRQEIVSMPWIHTVAVRRVLPNRLYIHVDERRGVIRWNDNALIGDDGLVFYPQQLRGSGERVEQWRKRYSRLPHLRGEEPRSSFLRLAFFEYNRELEKIEEKLIGLFEDDRRSQILLLGDNIVVRLGNEDHEIRLDRFIRIFPKYLSSSNATTVQFDMRYTNGFTVATSNLSVNINMGYN